MTSNLNQRTKSFALEIIHLSARLGISIPARVLGRQVLRSGTSIGANYREASRSRSTPEFISKIGDCLKEIEETIYWLELLLEAKLLPARNIEPILDESRQLCAIFTTIDKNTKARLESERAKSKTQ